MIKTDIVYKHFTDFVKKVQKMKLHKWEVKFDDTKVTLKHFIEPYIIPKYEPIIDDSLAFTCVVFGWIVPDDNDIYKRYKRSMRKIGLLKLLTDIKSNQVCNGVHNIESNSLSIHSVPCEIHIDNILSSPNQAKNYSRPNDCDMLLSHDTKCGKCTKFVVNHEKQKCVKKVNVNKPAKRNAPLTKTHPNRVQLAFKEEHLKSSELQKTIFRLFLRLEKKDC